MYGRIEASAGYLLWEGHLSLQKDSPIPRTIQAVGQTLVAPIFGGLPPNPNLNLNHRCAAGGIEPLRPACGRIGHHLGNPGPDLPYECH